MLGNNLLNHSYNIILYTNFHSVWTFPNKRAQVPRYVLKRPQNFLSKIT